METLRPTYRLLIGVPGRSNAFAITEHLGMDPAVVRAAKEIVGSENRQFESVLENLESARRHWTRNGQRRPRNGKRRSGWLPRPEKKSPRSTPCGIENWTRLSERHSGW